MPEDGDAVQCSSVQMFGITPLKACTTERAALRRPGRISGLASGEQADSHFDHWVTFCDTRM